MAKIERVIKHSFGLEGGKKLVSALATKLMENFGRFVKKVDWNEDKTSAKVEGTGFDGSFQVSESDVKLVLNLGLLTSALKGKIENEIDKHTTPEEMDKFAKSVELDANA